MAGSGLARRLSPLWPVANLALRLLRGRRGLGDLAEPVELYPAIAEALEPAISLPGEIERARLAHTFSTLEREIERAMGGERRQPAVLRYDIRNAFVDVYGVSVAGANIRRFPGRPAFAGIGSTPRHIERAIFCDTFVTNRYFGHWLQEACVTALLADAEDRLFLAEPPAWPHAADYADLFGFAPEPPGPAYCERISIVDDRGCGPDKRARMADLRARIRARVTPIAPGRRIYLRRGRLGDPRSIDNEEALLATLEAEGFVAIDPHAHSAAELTAELMDAACAVSLEGSHNNHLHIALAEGATVLVLAEPDRFGMSQMDYARMSGTRGAFVVLEGAADTGYSADISRVMKTLALAGQA